MKKMFYSCAFVFSAVLLSAQTTDQPVKVRIKKVENINGVEKITDTTFTTTDPSSIKLEGHNFHVVHSGDMKEKIVVMESDMDGTSKAYKMVVCDENMDKEIGEILKEAGIDPKKGEMKKVMIVHDEKDGDKKCDKKIMKVVVIKTGITDANAEEMKKAGISGAAQKLNIDDLTCTPNPSSGTFHLEFSSPDKNPAEIVIRDINGKIVYTESANDFKGTYKKEINLGPEAKGIYFVTVSQKEKATTKKLVVE